MATIPSDDLIKKLQEETRKAEKRKKAAQTKQGKDFENHGQGVIPEKVWKEIKKND